MEFAETVEEFRLLLSGGRIEAGFVARIPGQTYPSRLHGRSLPAVKFREGIVFLTETGGIMPELHYVMQA